jgi:NADP-dependent 3-hydroxy acid dehydrogenase YdfG
MSEWGAYAGPGGSDYKYSHLEANPDFWGKGLRQACIIGMGSEIGSELAKRLEKDGYEIWGTTRKEVDLAEFVDAKPKGRWDLLIFAAGTMEPIGNFFDTDVDAWEKCVKVNSLGQLRVLRSLWPARKHGAKVVFMSGPNPNVVTPTYTAYRAGKVMLHGLVDTLNSEYPDVKFLWLIPGVVKTKIHEQTLKAGERAANLERAKAIMQDQHPTFSHDAVYTKLKILLGENPFPENEGT